MVPGALSSSSSSPFSHENVALEESGTIELQGLLERSSVDDRTRHPASVLPRPDEPRDDDPIKLDQRHVLPPLKFRAFLFFISAAMIVALVSVSKSADQGQTSQAMVPTKHLKPTRPLYHSSSWEQLWINNIETWQNGKICDALAQQQPQLKAFMNATCSARTDTAWCLLKDSVHKLWFNTKNGTLSKTKPPTIHHVDPVTKVHPMDADIFSRFEWPDGRVEFIEPLVSHLRHPMMHCGDGDALLVDRSYLIPPPNAIAKNAYYFDAGASSWSKGKGGPSLSYFTEVWGRHGIHFDHIEGWEGSTTPTDFYKTVPTEYRARTHFHQQWIASSSNKDPFVPTVIRQTTNKEDYVLFKLDIDNGPVETGTVDHLLSDDNDDLDWIDEFVWEHHVDNYIMRRWWKGSWDKSLSIADSYQYFLRLRQKGVRAHSWV